MRTILAVALVLVALAAYSEAFQCYQCADSGKCADEVKDKDKLGKSASKDCKLCFKTKTKDSEYVARGCLPDDSASTKAAYCDSEYGYCCSTELCNGAGSVVASVLVLLTAFLLTRA